MSVRYPRLVPGGRISAGHPGWTAALETASFGIRALPVAAARSGRLAGGFRLLMILMLAAGPLWSCAASGSGRHAGDADGRAGSPQPSGTPRIRTGADVLLQDSLALIARARVGVLCNRASVLGDGRFLVDALLESGVDVVLLFTPEHGLFMDREAGAAVASSTYRGIPVVSLYGARRSPARDELRALDVLLVDLQDIGVRCYTYASTMALALRAAAEAGCRAVVLDRPNPINGLTVEGPVLDTALASFVGMFPIPVRHGLTIGELAFMIRGERWMPALDSLALTVVPMHGWARTMWQDETGLPWIPPSPNIRTPETALVYAGTSLAEGCSVSEGRGTPEPFHVIGSPTLDTARCLDLLRAAKLPGVEFEAVEFVPLPGPAATSPRFAGRSCRGIRVRVHDRTVLRAVETGMTVLAAVRLASDSAGCTSFLDRLLGRRGGSAVLGSLASVRHAVHAWKSDAEAFERLRARYLLPGYVPVSPGHPFH